MGGRIDSDGLKGRALSWIAWKLRAESWTLWELDFNSLRAWQYPQTYETQYGSGMLVHRGETMGLEEPAASIRLKGLRRGSQDFEYFWLFSRGKGGREMVDEAVNAVLHGSIDDKASLAAPGMWVHDPDAWERVRVKFGEAIEKMREVPADAHDAMRSNDTRRGRMLGRREGKKR